MCRCYFAGLRSSWTTATYSLHLDCSSCCRARRYCFWCAESAVLDWSNEPTGSRAFEVELPASGFNRPDWTLFWRWRAHCWERPGEVWPMMGTFSDFWSASRYLVNCFCVFGYRKTSALSAKPFPELLSPSSRGPSSSYLSVCLVASSQLFALWLGFDFCMAVVEKSC